MKTARPKIVVLGGGFGGLEAALYMKMRLSENADITIVSASEHFIFKPSTIYIPFGLDPGRLKLRLARPAKLKNIKLVQSLAREIDPITKHVGIDGYGHSHKVAYDYLVVATGAGARPEDVPGLSEFGAILSTPEQMLELRTGLHKIVAKAEEGPPQRVLFMIPPGSWCSGPLYEMAMLLDTWLQRRHVRERVDIAWSTYESTYVEAFGHRLHDVVAHEFAQRGILGYRSYVVDRIEKGEAVYQNGERLPFDLLLSFPPHAASTHFGSLPINERGFISTLPETRQVTGYPDIYAVGDASDFPVKQAYLASLQADAAAEHLCVQLLGSSPSAQFDPVTRYFKDGFDGVTLAQVPLNLANADARQDGHMTTEVWSEAADDTDAGDTSRVGSSPVWRLGKLALGVYLPWRFKAGNPFHAGAPWKATDTGLKIISGVLAPLPAQRE